MTARGQIERITLSPDEGAYLDHRPGSGNTWEIFDIYVPSETRRQGIGKRLLEKLFQTIGPKHRVFAITRTSNEIAQQFYEKMRFDTSGILRRFYDTTSGGADAVMYIRSSGGPI